MLFLLPNFGIFTENLRIRAHFKGLRFWPFGAKNNWKGFVKTA